MKKLGTVKNVIHDGSILLSASETSARDIPVPGARVYDARGEEIGRVSRVFGPIKEPYISLKPKDGANKPGLVGASMYLNPEEPAHKKTGGNTRAKGRRPAGHAKKKGVNRWQRKEKPRKR